MSVISDDLAYIHILKTGGISCRQYLLENMDDAEDATFESSPIPTPHIPVRDIPRWTGRPLDSFDKIVAVVRDPFDHQLSLWYHWRDSYARGGRSIYEMCAAGASELTQWLWESYSRWALHYECYIKGGWQSVPEADRWIQSMGAYEYYLTVDGEMPPNLEVVKLENLGDQFPKAVAPYLDDPGAFPHYNKSIFRDTPSYYTPMAMQAVHVRFRWTFERGWYNRKEWAGFQGERRRSDPRIRR